MERRTMLPDDAQIDPVCGMEVDPQDAAATSQVGGKTYYFCAKSCKARFDADPSAYGAPRPPS
jgi:Cu+-exporting ATPase